MGTVRHGLVVDHVAFHVVYQQIRCRVVADVDGEGGNRRAERGVKVHDDTRAAPGPECNRRVATIAASAATAAIVVSQIAVVPEPTVFPGCPRRVEGLDELRGANRWCGEQQSSDG